MPTDGLSPISDKGVCVETPIATAISATKTSNKKKALNENERNTVCYKYRYVLNPIFHQQVFV